MTDRLPLFWYNEPNFGDALNATLLPRYGLDVCWSRLEDAQAVGIGSILQLVPGSFRGTILGTGFMWEHNSQQFEHADCRLVRGRLTAERCFTGPGTGLGDPGLLVGQYLDNAADSRRRYPLGLIPHYVDQDHPGVVQLLARYPDLIRRIDIRGSATDVVAAIAECDAIASSSLHGLIAADALGKPNLWLVLGDRVAGKGFKFRDYFSAFAPDDCRQPVGLNGDENLSDLLQQMTTPGNAVRETIHRLDELLRQFVGEQGNSRLSEISGR